MREFLNSLEALVSDVPGFYLYFFQRVYSKWIKKKPESLV